MRFGKVVWSASDIDRLKQHRDNWTIPQLSGYLSKSRTAVQNKIKELDGHPVAAKKNKKSYIGKRKDIQGGLFLRSAWEADVCRWLQYLNISFIYEPRVFIFEGVKRGTLSYVPDFYLPELDLYLEVKGQLLSKNKTATRRFKKHYPVEFSKLRCIPGSSKTQAAKFFELVGVPAYAYFNELKKEFKDIIPNWES